MKNLSTIKEVSAKVLKLGYFGWEVSELLSISLVDAKEFEANGYVIRRNNLYEDAIDLSSYNCIFDASRFSETEAINLLEYHFESTL